ncbi:MAG: hypothetical protein Q7S27_01440 [Nanoarchaeota archaeon]|nr:hypothetical protein [Nanoarchaeota archaeon]
MTDESEQQPEAHKENKVEFARYKEILEQRLEVFSQFLNAQVDKRAYSAVDTDDQEERLLIKIPNVREYVLLSNVQSVFYNLFKDYGVPDQDILEKD